jgi:hypothetical protein
VSIFGTVSRGSYTIGPSCSISYTTTGNSINYIDPTGNAMYSYTWELRDFGTRGFESMGGQIRPTGKEPWRVLVFDIAECWVW